MAKDSKGQRVKSWKELVYDAELQTTYEVIQVYFKADHGKFFIYPPTHYVEALPSMDLNGAYFSAGERGDIYGMTLDAVVDGFKTVTEKYKELVKQQKKIKIIVIYLHYQSKKHPQGYGSETSFRDNHIQAPALHFDYELGWDVNGTLYRWNGDDGKHLHRRGQTKSHKTVEWTPEREEFFSRMKAGLQGLVDMLVGFFGNLEKDPDQAIAAFLSKNMLLAPPGAVEKDWP